MSETFSTPPPLAPEAPRRKSGLATASLICGIVGLVTCLPSIPAVITGHLALADIKKSSGQVDGAGSAKTGLILGYIGICLSLVILGVSIIAGLTAPMVIRQRDKADHTRIINHTRQVGLALEEYKTEQSSSGKPYPSDLDKLAAAGFAPDLDRLLSLNKNNTGDWLYFPQADPDKPDDVLLISPPVGKKQAVLQVDLMVKSVMPKQAQAIEGAAKSPPVRIPAPQVRP